MIESRNRQLGKTEVLCSRLAGLEREPFSIGGINYVVGINRGLSKGAQEVCGILFSKGANPHYGHIFIQYKS